MVKSIRIYRDITILQNLTFMAYPLFENTLPFGTSIIKSLTAKIIISLGSFSNGRNGYVV